MGILIDATDFLTNKSPIAQNNKTIDKLNAFIAAYEKTYLIQLLGVDLYALFAADLVSQVPQSAIYLTIYNSFNKEINSCLYSSLGMKEMLLLYIKALFVGTQPVANTPVGSVMNQAEVSELIDESFNQAMLYNEARRTYGSIQVYIMDNTADYPTFNGVPQYPMSSL